MADLRGLAQGIQSGFGMVDQVLQENIRNKLDQEREDRINKAQDLQNQLVEMGLIEKKKESDEKQELADRIKSSKAAGDFSPTTKRTPGVTATIPQYTPESASTATGPDVTTTTPPKTTPEEVAVNFLLEKGDTTKALALKKEQRDEIKDMATTMHGLFSLDKTGTVAKAMFPQLKTLFPNTLGKLPSLDGWGITPGGTVFGKTPSGQEFVTQADGVAKFAPKAPGAFVQQGGVQVNTATGEQKAMPETFEEKLKLAQASAGATSDRQTEAQGAAGLRAVQAEFNERLKGADKILTDKTAQIDPVATAEKYNEEIDRIEQEFRPRFAGAAANTKQKFDMTLPPKKDIKAIQRKEEDEKKKAEEEGEGVVKKAGKAVWNKVFGGKETSQTQAPSTMTPETASGKLKLGSHVDNIPAGSKKLPGVVLNGKQVWIDKFGNKFVPLD
jgi:hypothetical protein